MKPKPCIYKITFDGNEMCYIGQTINPEKRLNQHRVLLRAGKHSNKRLQNDYTSNAITNLIFEIIHECDREELTSYERHFIIQYGDKCYNGSGGKTGKKQNPTFHPIVPCDITTVYTEITVQEREVLRHEFGSLGKALRFMIDNIKYWQ